MHLSTDLTSSTHPSKVKEMQRNILRLVQRLEILKEQQRGEQSILDQTSEVEAFPQRPRTVANLAARSVMVVNTTTDRTTAAITSTQEL